ncbi:MAG: putative photosystem II stability/assembly factor [uncultured marine phage]|uniref:Putative photosystem II stability/assembly factor n=1 Tax=uncultured marine phage TaxID=707152 RepID=A0A8D9C8A9_9VIRU|nr:MAG: putative photosystem II stability/assembly factor [uncultured marine phage]
MWVQNPNTGIWERQRDRLPKENYNDIRQDLEDLRFYSKCLDGTSYLPINNLDSIYDILPFQERESWYVTGPYAVGGSGDKEINSSTIDEEYFKYKEEYGLTLKNLFTPAKVINDQINNFLQVDVATTEEISDILVPKPGLVIDETRIKNGHRILVKDQKTFVTLLNTVDPDTYFDGNYYITDVDTTTTSYFYFNEENGIYLFTNNSLVKTDDLDDYDTNIRYSVHVKLGTENRQTQYHLSRLKTGYYPLTSDNEVIEFLLKKNWVLRNQVEYQNILDIDFYDSLKHSSQIVGSYSIAERSVFVGDFGSIFVHQDNYLNIINNKFKFDLRDITEVEEYYWTVGKEGSALRIDKVDFSLKSIDMGTLNDLTSIDFYNNLRGIIVGDLNEIHYTFNGGESWKKLEFPEFENFRYNKVAWTDLNTVFVVGDNGTLIELTYDGINWTSNKKNPIKIESEDDEFELVDNVRDIISFSYSSTTPWSLTYSAGTSSMITEGKEGLLFVGDNDLIFLYDRNNFLPDQDYIYFSLTQSVGDIKAVESTGQDFYIISDKHYSFDINSFTAIGLTSNIVDGSITLVNENEYNNIYNWDDTELQFVGDNLTLESYTFSNPTVINDKVSTDFKDKLKSKLLFLDYDMGSKLNFFGDDLTYRVPEEVVVPICITGSSYSIIELDSKSGEVSWISYHKDKLKQFKYNTALATANQVDYSSTFRGITSSNDFTIVASQSTNDFVEVEDLLNVVAPTSPTYSLFMYDNLMIVKTDPNYDVLEGDIISMSSSIVSGEFMANRVELLGGDQFVYMYARFDETITNDITSSTQSFDFKNLNTWNDVDEFVESWNEHPVGYSYEVTSGGTYSSGTYGVCSDITFTPKYDEKNAYYNLQGTITDNSFGGSYDMDYTELFLSFGYTANYNILDYLSNIDPTFTSGTTFYSMPAYAGLPVANLGVIVDDNKLSFHPDFKFQWDTFWEKTFIDITVDGTSTEVTEKAFILRKYYDEDLDRYLIDLHKEIEEPTTSTTIDITSRRTLGEISDDLNEINNIQTNLKDSTAGAFSNYQRELNFKFNTDSYAKILLSYAPIKEVLSAIVYTDYKNEIALNLIDLGEQRDVEISSIASIPTIDGLKAKVITSTDHGLSIGDAVFISTDDKQYDGLQIVRDIVSATQFVTNAAFILTGGSGTMTQFIFDPYLNYIPSDIIDLGIDGKGKIAVLIKPDNVQENADETISLVNLDLTKYKFNLIEGLYVGLVAEKYPWILEAEITNATIGEDEDGVVWYDGVWHCGRWFGGTWYSGIWIDGEWYNGVWNSNFVTVTQISGKVDRNILDDQFSKWFGGNFHGGIWNNGSWYGGRWINGTWENGDWFDGQWDQGTHNDGRFMAGTWIFGEWNNGQFNCDQGQSIWIDGTWNGGDFECGIWKDGKFTQFDPDIKSRFGTRSTNSRKSIWESGKFFSGEFHSILREDEEGNPLYSLNHKYTVWYTGKWNNGSWYGGTAYNILWDNGTWIDGVLMEISIDELSNTSEGGVFKVPGVYPFNRNDEFHVIDNIDPIGTYSAIGTNDSPTKYLVKDVDYEIIGGVETNTFITTYVTFSVTGAGDINSSIVSKYKGAEWVNGIWFNGIFDGDVFRGGMWLRGVHRKGEFL